MRNISHGALKMNCKNMVLLIAGGPDEAPHAYKDNH